MNNSNSILDLIIAAKKIVISSHISPDADAIGSEVALCLALQQLGKDVKIINPGNHPANLQFLINHFSEGTYSYFNSKLTEFDCDLVIIVDTSQRKQFESVANFILKSNATIICIDHHLNPDDLFHHQHIDTTLPATGILIYNLISKFPNFKLTLPIAESLYAAIMTDTGSFRFTRTTGMVHEIIAKLVDAGANPSLIYEHIYETGSIQRLHLLGKALQSIQLWHNQKTSVITITKNDFEETKTSTEDLDNVVNFGFTIKGVDVSLMIVQLNDNFKMSFRSKGNFPANKLAQHFGGGGHLNAAGARYKSNSLEAVLNELKIKTEELYNSI